MSHVMCTKANTSKCVLASVYTRRKEIYGLLLFSLKINMAFFKSFFATISHLFCQTIFLLFCFTFCFIFYYHHHSIYRSSHFSFLPFLSLCGTDTFLVSLYFPLFIWNLINAHIFLFIYSQFHFCTILVYETTHTDTVE